MGGYGSHGTLVLVGDGGSPETFAAIADIKDIDGPGFTREMHDASVQTSEWATSIPGMKRGQTLTFPVNFDPAGPTHDHQTGLIADYLSGVKRNYQIVFSDPASTKWQVAAFVTDAPPNAPVDGILEASVTLTLDGEPAPQFGV